MNALAHFESLEREKVSLENETNRFNQERTQYELRLEALREQIKLIEDQNRELSVTVGTLHREETLRKTELEHLRSTMQRERKELEEHAQAVDVLLSKEREAKKAFCEEMVELNSDLGNLLVEQEGLCIVQHISMESLQVLQEYLMKQQAKMETTMTTMTTDDTGNEGILTGGDTILIQDSDAKNLEKETAESRILSEKLTQLTSHVSQLREMALQSSSNPHQKVCESFVNMQTQKSLLTLFFSLTLFFFKKRVSRCRLFWNSKVRGKHT